MFKYNDYDVLTFFAVKCIVADVVVVDVVVAERSLVHHYNV